MSSLTDEPSTSSSCVSTMDQDDKRLRQLGYIPVFRRGWDKTTNMAITVSAMSVLLSVPATFGTALKYGGPAMMVYGWIAVSCCCICIALGMAELSSAYPTSGGMYYWMARLLGPCSGPFVCWVTGWVNMLGQIASLASTHWYMTSLLQTFVLLATGTARVPDSQTDPYSPDYVPTDQQAGPGKVFTPSQTLGVYGATLVFSACINTIGGKVLVYSTEGAAIWHLVGVLILIIAVPVIATEHQPASWVFTHFESKMGYEAGLPNRMYIAVLGLLLPAFAYTGYDGPAHMAEESQNAVISNPRGIMTGMYFMAVTGFVWIISLLFCVKDPAYVLGEGSFTPEANGNVVAQIFWDVFTQRTGHGKHSLSLLLIILVGVSLCGINTMTYISRIMFAYSRDRAVPLASLWVKLAPNKVPVLAVWGVAVAAFAIAIPSVWNKMAFDAILSLSTIALNVAYVAPSFVRITFGQKRFIPGPWSLGKWAYPVNTIATCWVIAAVVFFSLPTEYPVDTKTNMNYAGPALIATLSLSVLWYWCPFIGAYRWFKGPVHELPLEETEHAAMEDAKASMATTCKPGMSQPGQNMMSLHH